jgi:hypothetical protein
MAVASSTVLAIQLIMAMVVGFDFHDGSSLGHDGSGDAHHGDVGVPHFQLLTVRNVVGFFAVMSWSGLTLNSFHAPIIVTILVSVLLGVVMMVIMAGIFFALSRLEVSGNMDMKSIIGQTATVYIPVPRNRTSSGAISVNAQGRKTQFDAVTDDSEVIATNALVRIIDINNNQAVIERI